MRDFDKQLKIFFNTNPDIDAAHIVADEIFRSARLAERYRQYLRAKRVKVILRSEWEKKSNSEQPTVDSKPNDETITIEEITPDENN